LIRGSWKINSSMGKYRPSQLLPKIEAGKLANDCPQASLTARLVATLVMACLSFTWIMSPPPSTISDSAQCSLIRILFKYHLGCLAHRPSDRRRRASKRPSERRSARRSRSSPTSTDADDRPDQSVPAGDAPPAHIAAIETALSELAGASGLLRNVHDVRVCDTSDGEVVNFHCDVDPENTVTVVHELVDGVERGLRRRFPAVHRVIGHAEPRAW
jgi:hypothetical protein